MRTETKHVTFVDLNHSSVGCYVPSWYLFMHNLDIVFTTLLCLLTHTMEQAFLKAGRCSKQLFFPLYFGLYVSKSGFSIWHIHPQQLSQPKNSVYIPLLFPPPLKPELTRAFCFLDRVGFTLQMCVWHLVIFEEDSGEVLCNSREETFQKAQN